VYRSNTEVEQRLTEEAVQEATEMGKLNGMKQQETGEWQAMKLKRR